MKEATFDTNIITAYFKGHPKVVQRMGIYQKQFGRLKLNILSYYELLRGTKTWAPQKDCNTSENLQTSFKSGSNARRNCPSVTLKF